MSKKNGVGRRQQNVLGIGRLVGAGAVILFVVWMMTVAMDGGGAESRQSSTVSANSGKENFAICLMKKGVIMYGVDTCEYCQLQKKMFGSAFEKINYINCDFEGEICGRKGIEHYPVWEINGQTISGVQTFAGLSRATGCAEPSF